MTHRELLDQVHRGAFEPSTCDAPVVVAEDFLDPILDRDSRTLVNHEIRVYRCEECGTNIVVDWTTRALRNQYRCRTVVVPAETQPQPQPQPQPEPEAVP